jgi:hypothetical protein
MPKYSFLLIVLALVLLAAIGINYWPTQHVTSQTTASKPFSPAEEQQDLQIAEDLIKSNQPDDALKIVFKHKKEIELFSDSGKKWAELFIQANEINKDSGQLAALYEFFPQAFNGHEKAILLVSENFLIQGKTREFQKLREEWKGKETRKDAWLILDGDLLLLQGKRTEAIDLLNSETFEGKADTPRLIRLALLNVSEQPKVAWDYLQEAYKKDPTNPEVHSYRAKLLEAVGKNSLAITEYIAAVQADPKNIYLKDQLAEFLLRNKQYAQALQIWTENLKAPSVDVVWIKDLFWSKVLTPVKFDFTTVTPPQSKLQGYIDYLIALKPGQYWDKAAFEKLPESSKILKSQQSTFWLRLIQAFKDKNETEAATLLQNNIFSTVSVNPALEQGLKRILNYRKNGTLALPEDSTQVANLQLLQTQNQNQTFFDKLNNLAKDKSAAIPADLEALLKSDLAIPAAFLSTDWYEVALQLNQTKVIPSNMPEWLAYGFTLATQANRGNMEALEFATKQTQTPSMALLTSELLIGSGSADSAIDILNKLADKNDLAGARASWLLAMIYIEKGKLKEAQDAVNRSEILSKEVLGKETLAKIALLEKNEALADQIYTSIEKQSPEAKSYLARKAFSEKNWTRARELTTELLQQYPTNALLQENLKKIEEEEKKGS